MFNNNINKQNILVNTLVLCCAFVFFAITAFAQTTVTAVVPAKNAFNPNFSVEHQV